MMGASVTTLKQEAPLEVPDTNCRSVREKLALDYYHFAFASSCRGATKFSPL
jgi:hypothetical protein